MIDTEISTEINKEDLFCNYPSNFKVISSVMPILNTFVAFGALFAIFALTIIFIIKYW